MDYYKTTTRTLAIPLLALPTSLQAVNLGVAGKLMHFDYEETDLSGN